MNYMIKELLYSNIKVKRIDLCFQVLIVENFGKDQKQEIKKQQSKNLIYFYRLFTNIGFVNYEALECFVSLDILIALGEL